MTIKELRKNLKKSLNRIKKTLPDFFYKTYEEEINRQKLLDPKHKKVKTIEKYIKILDSVKHSKTFNGALKNYKKAESIRKKEEALKKKEEKEKEINNLELEEVQIHNNIQEKINKIEKETKDNVKIKKDQDRIKEEYDIFTKELKDYVKKVEKSPKDKTISETIAKPYKISIEQFIYDILENLKPGEFTYNIECNDTWRTLNDRTCGEFYKLLMEDLSVYTKTGDFGSDAEYIREFLECDYITIERFGKKHKKNTKEGGFFKYYNLTDIDLSRYQIFKVNDPSEDYKDNCLVYALRQGGLNDAKYNLIKSFVQNREIPRTDFKKICEDLNISIVINGEERNSHKDNAGTSDEVYYIGEIDGHYFINEKTIYTNYSIKNYHDIKDKKDFNFIYKYREDDKSYRKDKNRVISSFDLIKIMFENKEKFFTDITINNSNILTTQFYNQIKLIPDDLSYDEKCLRKPNNEFTEDVSTEDENNERILTNIYFDFETFAEEKEIKLKRKTRVAQVHNPYVVCYWKEDGKKKDYRGFNCAWNFLRYLPNNTRLIAHNANFDYRFLIQYLSRVKEITRNNHFIKLTGYFQNKYIEIIDSYNFLPERLANFNKMFHLGDTVKEVMPYDIYTRENIRKKYVEIEEALKSHHLRKESKRLQFLENIEKWNLKKGTTYDIVEYSVKYCLLDCEILMKGFTTFRQWIKEQLDMDIFKVSTISSLAYKYLLKNKIFDDVYEMCGVPQLFISKCQVGGRCMVRDNEKYIFESKGTDDVMLDVDYTSLYPSAMVKISGFLKGKPKILIDKTKEFLDKCDGYFIEIKINKVGKERHMPLLSYMDEESGIRNFTNDMVDKHIFIDKIALEDAIKYQEIEYEIIKGYYYNEGFNDEIIKVINELFELRKRYKNEGNPIELVYKLILNSAYGKTILKATDTKTVVINNYKGDAEVYLSKNHNIIQSHNRDVQGGKNWRFKVYKPYDKHYNMPQVGVSILSMSKRLMNDVICLAEDNDMEINYTDTDSIHIRKNDYNVLQEKFSEKYNRELNGKNLGQMHDDFQIFDEEGDKIKCKEVYATTSIFLGKKSYLDKLVGITDEGKEIHSFHTRLKGITPVCFKYTTKILREEGLRKVFLKYKNNNDLVFKDHDNIKDYEDVYKALYEGCAIPFDLLAGGDGCHFKMHRDYSVEELDDFTRWLKF